MLITKKWANALRKIVEMEKKTNCERDAFKVNLAIIYFDKAGENLWLKSLKSQKSIKKRNKLINL